MMIELFVPLQVILPLTISALITAIVIGAEARQRRKATQWRTERDAQLSALLCSIEDTIRKAAKK
jgi:H+/Cl- antiporter ClcA